MRSLLAALLLSGASAADETSCWQIDGSASLLKALAAYSGSPCAVDVTIPFVAASYAPNESVALLWGVEIDADSSNAMDVPMPPDAMATLSSDNADGQVQILATYARTCASRLQCTPSTLQGTFTTAQSGNFSSSDATYFESLDDLSFAEEGNYTVAAVAVLGNADNATLLYYFQTFADIVVKGVEVKTAEYDSSTTYCRVTAQNPLDDLIYSSNLLASSDNSEIELAIDANHVVQAKQSFDVAWTATLTRNSSKDVQLPSPLKPVYVLDDDNTNESGYYTIVGTVVKLCERNAGCDEYSSTTTITSADLSANFTSANTAAFNASGILVPSTGWYAGFVQVTLAGNDADSQRYDFIRYFEVFATEANVAEQVKNATYKDDGSESYCWEVVAATNDGNVEATNVAFAGNSTSCPYFMNMSVSSRSLSVDSGVQVSWAVTQQTTYSSTGGVTVNTTKVYDEYLGQLVNLPQVKIYYCNDTTCSPFSVNKTLVYSGEATSVSSSDGTTSFSTAAIKIPSEGTYTLMAHTVVPNGDDFRFDVASFMRMTVTASSASAATDDGSTSHVGLILGLTLGCLAVIGLAVLGLAVMRRRRAEREAAQQKERRYSFFGFRPLSNTNELPTNSPNSGHGSDESGHFMYVKAQRSPMDMPRASSLSYDPYSRRSFVEAGIEDSGYSFTFSDPEPPSYPLSSERTPQRS